MGLENGERGAVKPIRARRRGQEAGFPETGHSKGLGAPEDVAVAPGGLCQQTSFGAVAGLAADEALRTLAHPNAYADGRVFGLFREIDQGPAEQREREELALALYQFPKGVPVALSEGKFTFYYVFVDGLVAFHDGFIDPPPRTRIYLNAHVDKVGLGVDAEFCAPPGEGESQVPKHGEELVLEVDQFDLPQPVADSRGYSIVEGDPLFDEVLREVIDQRLPIGSQEVQVLDDERGAFVDVQGDGDAVAERVELDRIVDPCFGEPVLLIELAQAGYVALELDRGEGIGFFLDLGKKWELVTGALQGDLFRQLLRVERLSVYKLEAKGAHFGLRVDVVGLRVHRRKEGKTRESQQEEQDRMAHR